MMSREPDQKTQSQYTLVNHKLLRNGYTTGTCAAAAAKAAAMMLFTGVPVEEMPLMTPAGVLLHLIIEGTSVCRAGDGLPDCVRCAVRKDGGDDIDVTDGILVFAEVRRICSDEIRILGGEGVGTVTRPGLDQPVGAPAINSGPRSMIRTAVQEICAACRYEGGVEVTISVPEGRLVAETTFNSQMGIVDGISILGTSGIVLPMSQRALLDSIELELKMLYASGYEWIIMSPGNYGAHFLREKTALNPDFSMKCSNFVGETLDMAEAVGIRGILFVAHIGKFIKLSGGIMNTHSRESDARMELLAAAALRSGVPSGTVLKILDCLTTDEALLVLRQEAPGYVEAVISLVAERIQHHLDRRTAGRIQTGVILFSGRETYLTQTKPVSVLRQKLQEQEQLLK